jgi:hypothetical protein
LPSAFFVELGAAMIVASTMLPRLSAYFSPSWTVVSGDRGRRFRGTWTLFQADRGRRFSLNVDD